ncbi:MAG: DUF3574 domain-containing protein [Verrucomicrobia bacterium]|nr:DUF3574 domain-containing protein [Verrucomicrobiota bacterium]MBU1910585.1 DUF3574 domain-containing protein [Verrucomicrobiota bacterium]
MSHLRWSLWLFALPVLMMAGAAPAGEPAEPVWTKTELYLGQNMPGGKIISRDEWAAFLDGVVTRLFPQGLTVFEAYGQMQHEDGTIERQTTHVVMLVHPREAASEKAVREVITIFREKFKGAQVMHLSSPVAPEFYAD